MARQVSIASHAAGDYSVAFMAALDPALDHTRSATLAAVASLRLRATRAQELTAVDVPEGTPWLMACCIAPDLAQVPGFELWTPSGSAVLDATAPEAAGRVVLGTPARIRCVILRYPQAGRWCARIRDRGATEAAALLSTMPAREPGDTIAKGVWGMVDPEAVPTLRVVVRREAPGTCVCCRLGVYPLAIAINESLVTYLTPDSAVVQAFAALRMVSDTRAIEAVRALAGRAPDEIAGVLCSKIDPPCRDALLSPTA